MSAAQPRYETLLAALGVIIRVEGFEASIRYRMTELKARLAKFGETEEISEPMGRGERPPRMGPARHSLEGVCAPYGRAEESLLRCRSCKKILV